VQEQRIASTRLADGTEVAYATAGSGPLLLFVGGWLSHLEHSWALPAERAFLTGMAHGRTLVRYDRPGCGLSGPAPEPTLDREVAALSAVVDAVRAERRSDGPIDVVASSLGVPVTLRWAAENPDDVRRLVLFGGWTVGPDLSEPDVREHVIGLVGTHWGLGSDVLTEIFAPDAAAGTRSALATYQQQCCSGSFAASLLRLCHELDVSDSLEEVAAPTLVLRRQGDRAAPDEQSRMIAERLPSATMRVLPGRSHLPYIGEVAPVVAEIRAFLGLPGPGRREGRVLTDRQREVAELVSQGLTNREIGTRLGITERSAEGHVERIRLRLDARSRAQIAAWWAGEGSPAAG
jgi:pimeloyl-ACP methyl ester carboxylesterase/DNA-binding CsgD family transcriptional regulator